MLIHQVYNMIMIWTSVKKEDEVYFRVDLLWVQISAVSARVVPQFLSQIISDICFQNSSDGHIWRLSTK